MIEPKNLWETKFLKIFEDKEKEEIEYFLNLVGIILHVSSYGDTISQLYEALDLESFNKVLQILSGRTITFPSIKVFRETLIMGLCFIYREKGFEWDDIIKLLPFPETEISQYRYGIKIGHLKTRIKKELYKILVGKDKKDK
jgi:predicted SpoU family rRNA methylase